MKNKVALLVVLVFVREYPVAWPSFAEDILGLLEQGDALVDLFLRITLALDDEVVARSMPRSEAEAATSTLLVYCGHGTCRAGPD